MRVFPNGFGFAILLGLAIGFASFNPALVQQWNLLGNGVLSQLIVILIFLLQGWKLDLKKLLKSLGNFDQTIRIQLGLLICPCFAVLVGDFFGWFEDDWFDAFLFLAFLPTTISSSVVYTRNAGGDADFALGQSTISNLISPFIVSLVWILLQEETLEVGKVEGGALAVVVLPKIIFLTMIPCFLGCLIQSKLKSFVLEKKVEGFLEVLPLFGIACLVLLSTGEVVSSIGGRKSLMILSHIFFPLCCLWFVLLAVVFVWSNLMMKGGFKRSEVVFCLSQKSLAMGVPMIQILTSGSGKELAYWMIPILVFHLIQLVFGIPLIAWYEKNRNS